MKFIEQLQSYIDQGFIPKHYHHLIVNFWESYKKALRGTSYTPEYQEKLFMTLLELMKKQSLEPFVFEPFHKQVRTPFDYYQFGLDFTVPLLENDDTSVFGLENFKKIEEYLKAGANVVLLANHQTELDPQIIACLMQEHNAELVATMIYVAGQKVLTDFLAIPFSMGCNLLCIYSKRYINLDPESKEMKQVHNQKTMKRMMELLKEGGKCIYVAPSGGRDRKNREGVIEVAPFDADSIEMFRLMALQAKTPTHFFPLALNTYNIAPPPSTIEKDVGERREAKRAKVQLCFGKECDMEVTDSRLSRHEKREILAKAIWSHVNSDYHKILNA